MDSEIPANGKGVSNYFGGDKRAVETVANGDRIATIVCHAMAQGLCEFIDRQNGHYDEENSPVFDEYCVKAGRLFAEVCGFSFEDIFRAYKNNGGPYMREDA